MRPAEGGYAYPSVNVTSIETLNATLRGFAEAESNGMVQLPTGGAAYLSGAAVGHEEIRARALAAVARRYPANLPSSSPSTPTTARRC